MSTKIVPTLEEFSNALTFNDFAPPRSEQYKFFTTFLQPIGKISSKNEAAMILAHMIYESDGLTEKEERDHHHRNNCQDFEQEDVEQGNLEKSGKFQDKSFHGRGYLRLKHCSNYREIGAYLKMEDELLQNPERIVNEEELSWKSAFALWAIKVHPNVEVQAGHFRPSMDALESGRTAGKFKESDDQISSEKWKVYQNVHKAFNLDPTDCLFD